MHAPAIVGGGIGKARTLAAQTVAVNPAAAALMQAQLQLAAKDFPRAEATMLSVQAGDDEMVADRQHDLLSELAQRYQEDKRYADSDRIAFIIRKRFAQ
jgi:alpha-beta hydrolase superfamily lysophospholipase